MAPTRKSLQARWLLFPLQRQIKNRKYRTTDDHTYVRQKFHSIEDFFSTRTAFGKTVTFPGQSAQSFNADFRILDSGWKFSEKGTADKLRNEFVDRDMNAIIATKEIGGRTYYQVKVGPYASSEEAKKWLLTVKAVRGASQDSFVTTR